MAAPRLRVFATENELLSYVAERVSAITGVQLGEKQSALVQSRLARRLRDVGCETVLQYARHFSEHETEELNALTSLLTTHHTYFFREFSHFEFLLNTILPAVIAHHRTKGMKTIRVWSAACSRGQEVYSLAMFLSHHLPKLAPEMDFKILGSDVDPESVGIAKNGVYAWQELKSAPAVYMQGNWQRGTGDISEFVRASEPLRKAVDFKTVNLLDFESAMGNQEFDVIFCRNVFIYFTRENIARISANLLRRLSPCGAFFVGLSESLSGLNLPVEWVGPSVYVPTSSKSTAVVPPQPARAAAAAAPMPSASPRPPVVQAKPLRVVCVDDSKTVLLLMAKILTKDFGFEIVGTAANGREAADKIRQLKPDLVTLDIHMPEMGGPEYLEKHFGSSHPPVVIVSSVSREDTTLAFRCIELGATDYVEKPSLEKLTSQADEIRSKLKAAMTTGRGLPRAADRLEASFKKTASTPGATKKFRIVAVPAGRNRDIERLVRELRGQHPPTVLLFDSSASASTWLETLPADLKTKVGRWTGSGADYASGMVYVATMLDASSAMSYGSNKAVSVIVFGAPTKSFMDSVKSLKSAHVILEDVPGAENYRASASSIVPVSSFVYESDRYLASAGAK